MNKDITLPCEDGIVHHLIGGRIKFGETTEDAINVNS